MITRVQRVLDSKHLIGRAVVSRLSAGDIRRIRAMAAGQVESPNRMHAIATLGRLGTKEARAVLAGLLANPREDMGVRISAALQLTRSGDAVAESALIKALRKAKEPVLAIKLIQSLARVGEAGSLGVLRKFAESRDKIIADQARFAVSIVSYRLGRSGAFLPVPGANRMKRIPKGASPVELSLKPAAAAQAKAVLSAIEGDAFGLRLSVDGAQRMRCGRNDLFLLFGQELARRPFATVLPGRPRLAGLIVKKAEVEDSYSVYRLVFTWPAPRGKLHIAVHRPDGRQMLYGMATTSERTLQFSLRSVAPESNALIEIAGEAQDTRLTFRALRAGRLARSQKLTPRLSVPLRL